MKLCSCANTSQGTTCRQELRPNRGGYLSLDSIATEAVTGVLSHLVEIWTRYVRLKHTVKTSREGASKSSTRNIPSGYLPRLEYENIRGIRDCSKPVAVGLGLFHGLRVFFCLSPYFAPQHVDRYNSSPHLLSSHISLSNARDLVHITSHSFSQTAVVVPQSPTPGRQLGCRMWECSRRR